jgi:hypothetical protein
MAAVGQEVSVGTSATLIFECVDAVTWAALSSPAANVFQSRNATEPLPLLISIPTGSTVYLGGSGVTSSSTGVGCPIVGPALIPYNATGGDSLYGVVASSTATVGLLALTQ